LLIRALPNGALLLTSTAWSPSIGTGGRHQLEPVVAINWNHWSSSIGTGGRHHSVRPVLSRGELNEVRVLFPETVKMMTTSSLSPGIRFAQDMIGQAAGAS